ncbi:MAG: hypothetical protein MRJ93_02690 [Nitrososphaeraceae archaeon]|nr:hypothetical protein [Nitrososphaeraceae archaeon]
MEHAEQNELEYVKSYDQKSSGNIILASIANRAAYFFARIEKNEIFKISFIKYFLLILT